MNSLQCRRSALAAAILLIVFCKDSSGQSSEPPTQPLPLLEALQSTLANQPALHIQEQVVVASRAASQQAKGLFDTVLGTSFSQNRVNNPLTVFDQEQAALLGIKTNNQASNVTTMDVGATKQYRSGVSISPSFVTSRTTDNIYNLTGTNLSTLSFQVTVPLLRGRGRSAVAAQETAAGIEVQASLLDLNQTISGLLANTAASYWNAVGAGKNLKVARASEERGKTYVENVQTLIRAGRIPEAEIHQANANLATRAAERIAAEQSLIAARQQLALAMGLSADQMVVVGTPSEDFPKEDSRAAALADSSAVHRFYDLALANRADYLAAKRRETEQRTLLTAARNATLPQLNLNLGSGYSSLDEGTGFLDFLRSPGRAPRGPDLVAGLTYRFPPSNNVARGGLILAESNLRQAELRTLQTAQNVMAAVVTALTGVGNAALQLQKAREASVASQAALEGEREKYRLGVAPLVDVLTMEDRLTVAEVSEVNAGLAYALALEQLRFTTGTIVAPDKAVQSVDHEVFFTVPISPPQPPAARKE